MDTVLIFLGAGLGGVLRFWISNSVHLFTTRQFPYGTLVVNVSGCFIMGLLFVLLFEKLTGLTPHLRALLLIGLLGGYTTFSSFSIETINLFENGEWFMGLMNVFLSVALCLIATWIGVLGGRQL